MNSKNSWAGLIGLILMLGFIFNWFGDDFQIPVFFFILIGISGLSRIFKSQDNKDRKTHNQQQPRSYFNDLGSTSTTKIRYKTHECEYCGEMNDENREYCEHCGARLLDN